jgi:hypothetical protein
MRSLDGLREPLNAELLPDDRLRFAAELPDCL